MPYPHESQWKMPPSNSQSMRLVPEDLSSVVESKTLDCDFERRLHRRFDLEAREVRLERLDTQTGARLPLGTVLDLSAGGLRLRTNQAGIQPEQQIRIRLKLPTSMGISPFVDLSGDSPRPTGEWTGWLAVSRVRRMADGYFDVAGRLLDMEEMDRGMLSLYLSTQPLAA